MYRISFSLTIQIFNITEMTMKYKLEFFQSFLHIGINIMIEHYYNGNAMCVGVVG